MKYLANWQPLENEDRHTAMLFGFLRHAPATHALDPWLASVLGREARARPIEQRSFWPRLPSVVPGSLLTEPEVVFEVDDGSPLTVVIEVKPGYAMHTSEQIERELIDVAMARNAERVCCVMIGADLGAPVDTEAWRRSAEQLARTLIPDRVVEIDVRYASFESLGRAIATCGAEHPEWSRYAEDVCAQLRRRGLMGYDGAPMLDDLEEMTVPSAVEAFNRAIRAARGFVLRLHADPVFQALALGPQANDFRLLRNGNSVAPTASVEWFETTVAMSLYRRPAWDRGQVVFVCFDLLGSDTGRRYADLCVGACWVTGEFTYGFARTEAVDVLPTLSLDTAPAEHLIERRFESGGEWRLARRPWTPSDPDEDLKWTLDRLREASDLWDEVAAGIEGLTHHDFAGKSTETLRLWRRWWSDPKRDLNGAEEAGRHPAAEVAKLDAELLARGVGIDP